jgi:AbiV family abortive infection protein
VNLGAVKEAPARVLTRSAVAAAKNACGLVEDAELLSGAGRLARAYSLAGLAVEEVGKADGLAALAGMPESLRARAPVGRMLGWHQMKLVAGRLIGVVPGDEPACYAARMATMPVSEVAEMLNEAQAFAEDADRLKQRGLYVDLDHSGYIREPSEVTAAEVREQLDRARQAASAVIALLDPGVPLLYADTGADGVEMSSALFSAFGEIGHARSPEAAADVLRNAVTKVLGVRCNQLRRPRLVGDPGQPPGEVAPAAQKMPGDVAGSATR